MDGLIAQRVARSRKRNPLRASYTEVNHANDSDNIRHRNRSHHRLSNLMLDRAEVRAMNIRWLIRRDMPEVLAIETAGFEFPWSEEDFIRRLRLRNCIGMVAECDARVVGFMIYELHKNRLRLLNIAVHPKHQRMGYATALIDGLKRKLNPTGRAEIVLDVSDANLPAQLFFSAQAFRAVTVISGMYEKTEMDAYQFIYSVRLRASV